MKVEVEVETLAMMATEIAAKLMPKYSLADHRQLEEVGAKRVSEYDNYVSRRAVNMAFRILKNLQEGVR